MWICAGTPDGGMVTDKPKHTNPVKSPGWAHGLRQIYDTVVDEPLPDTFKDLLAKLDAQD